MKIIFLEAVQEYGGAQMATLELASRLSACHEVLLVDCYGSCRPFLEAVHQKGLQISIIQPRSEPYIIFKYSGVIRNLIRALRYIPHWMLLRAKVDQLFSEFKPELVVVYNTKVLSLLKSKKNSSYKSVYYAHGWYIPKQLSKITRFCLKQRVNKILCISEATRQALYANNVHPLDEMYVVHNAIDENLLPTSVADIPESEGCFKILHSGAFIPDKGIHISVEIAKTLRDRGIHFKLIIAGLVYHGAISEKYYSEIEKMIADYGLGDSVILVRDKSNVIDYFRACDIVIHPSATEGLPLVVMEAMVLKKPVIANAVGGITDLILHGFTGILPQYNNVNEYADHIIQLKDDKALYDKIAGNAYSLIKCGFDVKNQAETFNRLLDNL